MVLNARFGRFDHRDAKLKLKPLNAPLQSLSQRTLFLPSVLRTFQFCTKAQEELLPH